MPRSPRITRVISRAREPVAVSERRDVRQPRRDYRRMATVGALFALALATLWYSFWTLMAYNGPTDWALFENAANRVAAGLDPYVETDSRFHLAFRWSPLVAWALVPITMMPFWLSALLHIPALAGFRDWRVAALAGLSWPFLVELLAGGVMIFVALAAWWAYRGSRWGTAVFLGFAILIPRPLMVPLLVWLLWHRPGWRVPFAVALLVHAGVVVLLGWHDEWIGRLLVSDLDIWNPMNIGPSRMVGAFWVPVGVLLAVILTWKGHLGWASLAISPYWLPPYLLMLVLEWPPLRRERRRMISRRRRRAMATDVHERRGSSAALA